MPATVRLLSFDEATWAALELRGVRGWAEHAANEELLRDAVEAQAWLAAPVFIGTRSTMSELNMLRRPANCTVYVPADSRRGAGLPAGFSSASEIP